MIAASTGLLLVRKATRRPMSLSFAASAAVQGLNVLTGVVLARSLGPHDRGALAAVMLWPAMLASIGGLGIGDAIIYYTARSEEEPGVVLGSGLFLCILQSTALVATGAVVVSFVVGRHDPEAFPTALLYLAFIPTYLASMYLMATLMGLHRHSSFQGLRLLVVVLSALGLLLLAALGTLTVRSAVVTYITAVGIELTAAAFCCRRILFSGLRFERRVVGLLLSYGVRSHGGSLAATLNERLDQLLISVFLAPTSLGLYVIAVTLTSVTNLVGGSASLVALPSIARLPPGPERDRAARRMSTTALVGSVAVTIPVFVLMPQLVAIFFGDRYRGAASVARILVVAAIALSTNRVLGAILRAVGRPADSSWAELLALAVTAVGLAALVFPFGLTGAAITSLIAYTVSLCWMANRVTCALGLTISKMFIPDREMISIITRAIHITNAHSQDRIG
jgi:O-antigen/teichoic acid export membrane protein